MEASLVVKRDEFSLCFLRKFRHVCRDNFLVLTFHGTILTLFWLYLEITFSQGVSENSRPFEIQIICKLLCQIII